MIDHFAAARALLEQGDVDGAERSLATGALSAPSVGERDKAARALVVLCERRGEVSLRAQQALDEFLLRASDEEACRRVRRLYEALGLTDVSSPDKKTAAMPELPSLDGFSPPAIDPTSTQKQARVQSLADVASDVFADDDGSDTVPTTPPVPTAAPVAHAAPAAHATPGSTGSTGDVMRAFAVGSVIQGRYEVRAQIGRGGHATVVRVFDRELSEECALKVFHNTGDAADVARFKREVSVSRKIVHENVVTLYDIGQEQGFYYLTMELLDGADLSGTLKKRAVTMGEALSWLIDACRGLHAAHAKGVVHRDVKPGNLFILQNNRLKVMDFGIAKPADALSLTSTGVFVGTPQFVSPEQVQGLDVGPAADIYSLGVVAYLMLTGSLPFRDKEMMALLMKHATAVPDSALSRNPALPKALDALVMACLAKKAAERPKSCAVVADELELLKKKMA